MSRYLIPLLIVINLLLLGQLTGWLPGLTQEASDPGPMARQVNPDRLRIVPPAQVGPPPRP